MLSVSGLIVGAVGCYKYDDCRTALCEQAKKHICAAEASASAQQELALGALVLQSGVQMAGISTSAFGFYRLYKATLDTFAHVEPHSTREKITRVVALLCSSYSGYLVAKEMQQGKELDPITEAAALTAALVGSLLSLYYVGDFKPAAEGEVRATWSDWAATAYSYVPAIRR